MITKQVRFAATPIIYPSDNQISNIAQASFNLKEYDSVVPLESCLKFPNEPKINLRTEFHENENNINLLGILILFISLFALFVLIYYSLHMLLQVEIEKQVSQTASRTMNSNS